ncbi:MAG: hypothetical protein QG646_356 [Euryarchaeota archaeon]|nr:hypothetical protein [Euryarchaeota archaeon]
MVTERFKQTKFTDKTTDAINQLTEAMIKVKCSICENQFDYPITANYSEILTIASVKELAGICPNCKCDPATEIRNLY